MVDVASMMQKLEKSEKAREEIEQKLMAQDAKMGTTTPTAVSSFRKLCPAPSPKTSCRLHSVSVVRQDDDLPQFELCDREAQLHFQSIYLFVISAETCAGTSKCSVKEKLNTVQILVWNKVVLWTLVDVKQCVALISWRFLSRRRRQGESAAGAGEQGAEPGAGGGEEHAGRHGADAEDDGAAERRLPRAPLQELQHPDGHRQRNAGRPEESKSTLAPSSG